MLAGSLQVIINRRTGRATESKVRNVKLLRRDQMFNEAMNVLCGILCKLSQRWRSS